MNKPRIIATSLLLACSLALGGCIGSTVTPDAVVSEQASFDGAQQNSGILCVRDGAFVVTEHFVERYNALIAIYGDSKDSLTRLPYFVPALKRGHGVSQDEAGAWVMSAQAMSHFLKMNAWRKAGRFPM